MTEPKAADTATYKPICCYQCGEPFIACTFKDVWTMTVDGKKHQVPLYAVPCMRCVTCDLAVIDGSSDEIIQYCYIQYCKAHGLYTPWRRFCRWLRALWWRIQCKYERSKLLWWPSP